MTTSRSGIRAAREAADGFSQVAEYLEQYSQDGTATHRDAAMSVHDDIDRAGVACLDIILSGDINRPEDWIHALIGKTQDLAERVVFRLSSILEDHGTPPRDLALAHIHAVVALAAIDEYLTHGERGSDVTQ